MALNIKIDLSNRYPIINSHPRQGNSEFDTILKNGAKVRMGIRISPFEHLLLPSVHNLAFGSLSKNDEINDQIKLSHQDHNKVFSTIIFEAVSFLTQHPGKFIGIDGSNMARAYMYFRCIQNNFSYLNQFFNIFGVKYYMRLLRPLPDDTYDLDFEDVIATPIQFEKTPSMHSNKLYNYFIFSLKKPK
jgi:hypothetical protein